MPAKKTNSDGKVKIRRDRKFAEHLNETENKFVPDNPIKRQIKINQLPWTEKQKEFFSKYKYYMEIKLITKGG